MKHKITLVFSILMIFAAVMLCFVLVQSVFGETPALTPKETPESLKLQLAIERERTLQLEFQALQQSIEPQLMPLRQKFAAEDKEVAAQVNEVKKQNNWGDEIVLDKNPASPTFGQFIVKPEEKKAEPKK